MPPQESIPEKYLREIRDLQKQNLEILKKLTIYEEKKIFRGRWAIFIKTLGILLPYIFSIFLAWVFYMSVLESVNSLKEFVIELPKNISLNAGDQWDTFRESTQENIKDKWSNLVD